MPTGVGSAIPACSAASRVAATFTGRVTVIGGGVMGEAIVAGWLKAGAVDPAAVTVVEPSAARRAELASLAGVNVVGSAEDAPAGELVVLAVKPQVIEAVVVDLGPMLAGALVVSIAVGVSSARLEALMAEGTALVRVMPNTPAMVGEGMAIVSAGSSATPEQAEMVRGLFALLGDAVVLDERYQNAGAALSGSGPAYFALVIDALSRAGVAQGLPRAVAQRLAVQTMRGTAEMLDVTGVHPDAMIDAVTSPGGTTIAAITALEDRGVRAAFSDAVRAAVKRAEELG